MADWDDYSRVYDEKDITPNTILVELTTRGLACAPVSFAFWLLMNNIEALPGFHEALAEVIASEGGDDSTTDEVSRVTPLLDFLAVEQNQAELREDYNSRNEEKRPSDFKFKIPGDEALIAAAINAHNQNQL